MTRVGVGPPLVEQIVLAYRAKRPALLEGDTGLGKSAIIEEAAGELDIDRLVIDLTLLESTDLTGLPVIADGLTTFAPPAFLPREGAGLLFFDEVNRAQTATLAPLYQLLTTRRLNSYELPDDWLPVAAINPDEDGYAVQEMDKALRARFTVIRVEPNVGHWVRWASANGVHPAVVEFVRVTPDIFRSPETNPRAWTYVSHYMHAYEGGQFSRGALLAAVAGHVGEKLARAFLRTYRNAGGTRMPSVASLLASYSKGRSKVLAMKKAGDTARLNALCLGIQLYLQEPSNEGAVQGDARLMANLVQLVADLPAQFRRKVREECGWIPRAAPTARSRPRAKKKRRKR